VKDWARPRLALAFAFAFIVASCSHAADMALDTESKPALNAVRVALLPTTAPGLPTFDVEKFNQLLGQLRGTPVIVNIWASWCGPCRAEAPILAEAARAYGKQIQFLGVDILDSVAGATAFELEFHIPYPSVFDSDGNIRDSLGLLGQPDTIFYGADGATVATVSGQLSRQVLSTNINKLIGTSGPSSTPGGG
jgi:thiol-disulfide isomerase/thioredoxin